MNYKCIIAIFAIFWSHLVLAETYNLHYKARSGIIPIGEASIYVENGDYMYNIRMERNLSWPGVIKEESTTAASGKIQKMKLSPKSYIQTRKGKELTRRTKIHWSDGMPTVDMDPLITTTTETTLNTALLKGSVDPLSLIYYVMHNMGKKGTCQGDFVGFDGFSSTSISLQSLGDKTISTALYKGKAAGCNLQMYGTSGLTMGGKKAGKTVHMSIWLAPVKESSSIVPVLIQSGEGVRAVSLQLVDFSK